MTITYLQKMSNFHDGEGDSDNEMRSFSNEKIKHKKKHPMPSSFLKQFRVNYRKNKH